MSKDVRNENLLKMAASAESIGSCSLDVDYTTSESNAALLTSRLGFKPSPSQRTLHSFDSQRLLAQSSEEISSVSSQHTDTRRQPKLNNTRDIYKSEDSVFSYHQQSRKPSYVNISCSVSGYTPAINYHCLKFGLSSLQSLNNPPLILTKRKPKSFTDMMNGANGKTDYVDCASGNFYKKSPDSFCSQFTKTSNIFNNNNRMTSVESTTVYKSSLRSENTNGTNGAEANTEKSFIQQRVERLYGRGAFAPSFYKQKSSSTSPRSSLSPTQDSKATIQEKTATTSPTKIPELPVLKLLRPEFRDQLTISSSHSTPWWRQQLKTVPKPATNGSSQERIIPITLEADVITNKSKLDKSIDNVCDVATQAEEVPQDLQPAADEVIPIVSAVSPGSSANKDKDGHHFLKLHAAESQRLLKLADKYEAELESNSAALSEDIKGKFSAAFGKARLLVRQKLKQFEGLCHRNLDSNCEEPFPTTCQDLAGFWDMVYLQVEHIDQLFSELDQLRANGWIAESTPKRVPVPKSSAAKQNPRPGKSAPVNPKMSEKAQEAARQREEQRKKLIEERRRLAKLQKKSDENIEIFAPNAE